MTNRLHYCTFLVTCLCGLVMPLSASAQPEACDLLSQSELARIIEVDRTGIEVTAGDRALYGSGSDRDCLWTWDSGQIDTVLRIRVTASTPEQIVTDIKLLEANGESVDGVQVSYQTARLEDGRRAAVSSVYGGDFDRERTLVTGLDDHQLSMVLRHRQVGPGELLIEPQAQIMLAIASAIVR